MNDDIKPPEFVNVELQEMLDAIRQELSLPTLKPVTLPVTAHTVKPVERHYYNAVLRANTEMQPMLIDPPPRWTRRVVEMEESTFFYEYQDCNLWLSPEVYQPPIFGKFDFLKDLK